MSLLSRRKLTTEEMIELEAMVADSSLMDYHRKDSSFEDLRSFAEDRYHLEVRTGANIDKPGRLVCPETEGDPWLVLLRSETPSRFDLMHEIVHYVFDAKEGAVKRKEGWAEEEFSENKEAKDPRERQINYMAVAVLLPKAEILKRIKEYDASRPRQDEFIFLDSIETEYGQSRNSVVMRIQEVRRLNAVGAI